MKTNKFFTLAAIACGFAMTLTSCSKEDNPADNTPKTQVISFENQALNADNYWIGEENDKGVSDGWGGGGMMYPCSYTEGIATVNTTYCVSYWTGFAIAARTETSFASPYSADQFNNVAGSAHTGKSYLVAQYAYSGENITLSTPATVKSLWYTNSSYPVNSILNGDSYSGPKFDQTDWLTCTIIGTHADGTTASVDIALAKDGSYVKDWQRADLSALGKVTALSFSFSGSRTGDYGLNTPAYICIDDIEIEQ